MRAILSNGGEAVSLYHQQGVLVLRIADVYKVAYGTVCKHAIQYIEIITAHTHSVTLETILIAGRKCVDILMHFRCM